ncbi:MAG: HAMP domain-containing sensor histidine kinase [Bacteroidota bacterium]|nr:HAMP domain-containing sensor histidine kinase [Bacteroidota bacterium]
MRKRRVAIILMILTIGTIVAFQASWLRKNYIDERKLFTIRTNLLFRETMFKMQASRMHLDTSIGLREQGPPAIITMKKMIHDRVTVDSSGQANSTQSLVVTMDHLGMDEETDSPGRRVFFRTSNSKIISLLAGLDSLAKPITAAEISPRYAMALAGDGIHLPFRITARPGDSLQESLSSDSIGNKVVLGFSKPLAYEVHFDHMFWYMAARIGPQALFSLLLVGFTVLSLLLLYRNWQQQRRLTELKNDFISNITHELKTPIATVSVAVEALRKFNALEDPARTKEYLDISAEELQRLSLLVDKVLKLSLFERQEIELKKERFDMRLLAKEVLSSMRLQFEKYGAKVSFHAAGDDDEYQLYADKLHFTSVLFNLLDNALKYSKSNPSIQIDLSAGPEQLALSVVDNGIGIPAAYKDRIFEKFFRVPTGDKHNVKGYGMGLSYVYYILQRQGATIRVDSEEGIGSRFLIRIPRQNSQL